MPAEDIGSMQVEYAIETRQALSHLNDMSRYLEMVAAAAEYNAEAVDQMTEAVGRDLEKATSKYEMYAAATADYLKKVKHGWLVVTAAAVGMIYGLIRASSYGSIYMKQFGAATRMLADVIMEKSGLNDTIQIFMENYMDLSKKLDEKGVFATIISEIEDVIRWFNTLDTKTKALVLVIGTLSAAIAILSVLATLGVWLKFVGIGLAALGIKGITFAAIATKIGAVLIWIKAGIVAVGSIIAGVVATVGATTCAIILAVVAVIAVLAYLWSQTESGQKVIADLTAAWDTFWVNVSEMGYIEAIKKAWSSFFAWIEEHFGLFIRPGSPIAKVFTWIDDKFGEAVRNAFQFGKDFIFKIVSGLVARFPILKDIIFGARGIYYTIKDGIWMLVERAWGWGANIISNLVGGIKSSLPTLDNIFKNKIPDTVTTGLQQTVDIADAKGTDLVGSFSGTTDKMTEDFDVAFDHWQALIDNMERSITVDFTANYPAPPPSLPSNYEYDPNTGLWLPPSGGGGGGGGGDDWSNRWNNGGSWGNGGYNAASWSIGWAAGAIGGHVAREGTATIHAGEDIVRLKQLLSGLKTDQTRPTSVIVSPTIHIHVDSERGRDARKIARLTSDEIGKEVRRLIPTA